MECQNKLRDNVCDVVWRNAYVSVKLSRIVHPFQNNFPVRFFNTIISSSAATLEVNYSFFSSSNQEKHP